MKTHKLWLTAPVSSTTPTPRKHCSPLCSGLGAQVLITTTAEASRTHGCQALPTPKCCQLTKKQRWVLGADHSMVMKVFTQLIFLFPVYQTYANETVAVLHHQGRCSAEKCAAKQRAGLYTCHLQPAVPWASCVCVHTWCPCLTRTSTLLLAAHFTIYNHVLWYGCRRHQPPLRSLGRGHLCAPCLALRIFYRTHTV